MAFITEKVNKNAKTGIYLQKAEDCQECRPGPLQQMTLMDDLLFYEVVMEKGAAGFGRAPL